MKVQTHTLSTRSVKEDEVQREWLIVDAKGKTLGRLATQIAMRLKGKQKPTFTPHTDTGDFVVVINAEQIAVTGKKLKQKMYHRHTSRPGSLKTVTLENQLKLDARKVLEHAVKGMLGKTPLGRAMIKKLKIYNTSEHPHAAQQPKVWDAA